MRIILLAAHSFPSDGRKSDVHGVVVHIGNSGATSPEAIKLDKNRQWIWDNIQSYIGKAESYWQKVNKDDVTAIMATILQVGTTLPSAQQVIQSEKLWAQFQKRRNCSPAKSCGMTWLYVVGVFHELKLIHGNGPTLCDKVFFPENKELDIRDDEHIDYNCITKAENRETKSFNDIISLVISTITTYCKSHGIHLEGQG